MDLLAMKRLVAAMLILLLAACDRQESRQDGQQGAQVTPASGESASATQPSVAEITTRIPPAVRYPEYPSGNDEVPAAIARTNPLEITESVVSTGETLFAAMNCDGCHGGGGFGVVGPSLVDGRWRYGGDDSAVFQSIYYGRPKGMPAYGGMLNETVVWQLISYLRAQPQPDVVPTLAWSE